MKSICLVGVMFLMSACGTSGLKNHLVHINQYDSEVIHILHQDQIAKK